MIPLRRGELPPGAGLLVFVRWLHQVCLAIWIGGIVVIGAVVAPIAFRHSGLEPRQAGSVVGGSLGRFNVISYVAGALLILAELAEIRLVPRLIERRRRLAVLRLLAAGSMLGLALYLGLGLAPAMTRDRASGEMARFDAGHRRYERLADMELGLALASALLTAALSLDDAVVQGRERPAEATEAH
jgi:uncharacterized membrane protein